MADNFYTNLFDSKTPKTIFGKQPIQVTTKPTPAPRKTTYAQAKDIKVPLIQQKPAKKVTAPVVTKAVTPAAVVPTVVAPVVSTPAVETTPVQKKPVSNKMSDIEYMTKIANSKAYAGKTGKDLADAGIISKGNIDNYNKLVTPVDTGLAVAATTPSTNTPYMQSAVSKEINGPMITPTDVQPVDTRFADKMAAAEKGNLYGNSNSAMESGYDGGELEGLASSVATPKVVYTNPNVSAKAQAQFTKDMADTAGMNAFDREVWLLQNRNR